HREERPLPRRLAAPGDLERHHRTGEERQGGDRGWALRGDQGAARWLLPGRVQGPGRSAGDCQADSVGALGLDRGAPAGADFRSGENRAGKVNVGELYKRDYGRILASLIRLVGDFELAEDALHEAFAIAVEEWPAGPPQNPVSWLISTARHKALDQLRHRAI